MDTNRALWQPAKLEMKGKLIVLDLTGVAAVLFSSSFCARLRRLVPGVAGTGQMLYTAESHA